MDSSLRESILAANRELHAAEGERYEDIHPELFNWFEQGRIQSDFAWLGRRLGGLEDLKCLDIGAGTGNLTLKLLRMGAHVTALDISPELQEVLRNRLPKEHAEKCEMVCGALDGFLRADARRFDLVVMSSVVHHFPDYVNSLGGICGCLDDNGWVYITHEPVGQVADIPDPFLRKALWQLDYLWHRFAKRRRRPSGAPIDYRMADYNLYHGFEVKTVLATLKSSGMTIERQYVYSSGMRSGWACWLDTHLIRRGDQFTVFARKAKS